MKYITGDNNITNYLPNCQLNMDIQKKYNITDSNDYRIFLQHNGDQVKNFLKDTTIDTDATKVACPVCNTVLYKSTF